MSTEPFDNYQVSHMIAYFADRLSLVFAHFFCAIEFDGDKNSSAPPTLNDPRALGVRMIRSACMHTTLLALRDLDDVLRTRPPKSRPDSIYISDFGYPHSLAFLAVSERTSINKAIAHSTTVGADVSHGWDIFKLVTKCLNQSNIFFDWLEQHRDRLSALYCRTGIQSTYDYVATKLREIHIRNSI